MGRRKKVYYCKMCGKRLEHRTKSGLCRECAMKKDLEVIKQLHEKKGFYYEKWKQRIVEGIRKAKSGGKAKNIEEWKEHTIKGVLERDEEGEN